MTNIHKKVKSDHIKTWSDINERLIYRISSSEAKDSYKQTPASRCHSSRFSDQALQALWKARMQVCWWPWAWSQVLPFCQPARKHTAYGLYSTGIPGTSRRICREFSKDKTAFGRNQLNQPRTSSPSRTAIGVLHGTSNILSYRHCRDRSSRCQYARSSSASRSRRFFFRGGPD